MRTMLKSAMLAIMVMVLAVISNSYGQGLSINSTGLSIVPNVSADLHLQSPSKGLLPNRVTLTGTTDATTVASPATSLLVYNTATAGTAPNNVIPGYYYNAGTSAAPNWVRLLNHTTAWTTIGNYGTTASTSPIGTLANNNFAGTRDNTGYVFVTNGFERGQFTNNGRFSVNNNAPLATDLATVTSSAAFPWAINGYNAQATGSGLYASNTNVTNVFSALDGDHNGSAGSGVLGSYVGASSGIGISGVTGQYIGTATTGIRIGVRGYSGNDQENQNIGVLGSYNGAAYGAGVHGVGYGGGIIAGNVDVAVVGWRANNENYSGYFNGNHVVASGTKSASVGTSKGNQLLYVTELPEVWFEDVGGGQLLNGSTHIALDDLFLETIFVDDTHPMRIFLQEEGESNGLIVIKDADHKGFTVKEKNGGTSNISFSYRIMAKRLHFQDHRFGCDPVWGSGDTRKFNNYATPPPVDYDANVTFQEDQKKNWKPTLMPEGFTYPKNEFQLGKWNQKK